MPGIYTLNGVVKHYDWGGISFIPSLLQVPNKERKPFAEYWLGVHPLGTSTAETGGSMPTELTMLAPELSFLLKILDVKEMLSIQVHPSKKTAGEEFEKENAAGIPLDSPQRNYKDPNHKPELSVALGDFWLLHGFKNSDLLTDTLLNVAALQELLPVFQASGHRGLYRHVMEMPQPEVNRIMQPLLDQLGDKYRETKPGRQDADYWVLRAAKKFAADGPVDRGIFSIYFFNIVHLKKGEGIFQDAGLPHAYLEGQIVEIMSNSDNVLRGGLTTKHTDVGELLKNVVCEGMVPEILAGEPAGEGENRYITPYPDFRLSRIALEAGDTFSFSPETVEIILLTEGAAELDDDKIAVKLAAGSPAAVVFPGQTVYLAAAGNSTVFRASGIVHSR